MTRSAGDWREVLCAPAPKAYRRGTHRTLDPDDTLRGLERIERAAGITRVANLTGLDYLGIPVAAAIRPGSRSISVSQGKGIALAEAMVSAVMEAIETFHAEDIAARSTWASFRDLSRGCAVLDPKSLNRTSRRFDEVGEMRWIAGHDLLSHAATWLPYELVHTDYRVPLAADSGYFVASTNGLGAGNHIVEAILAALCEVIERDAVALWHAASRSAKARRRLDLSSVDDLASLGLISRLQERKMGVRIWDVTSDIGIAAFLCDLREAPGNPNTPIGAVRGSGCHPARSIALCRALTEAAQARLTLISGARDDLDPGDYGPSVVEDLGALLLDLDEGEGRRRRFREIPDLDNADLAEDLRMILAGLARAGLERVVAVDLTRAELGVPVVRVVVPGLEGPSDHPDYRPGSRARRAAATSP